MVFVPKADGGISIATSKSLAVFCDKALMAVFNPAAIDTPAIFPVANTLVKVNAVPKSTTIVLRLYLTKAATALDTKSEPISAGFKTSNGRRGYTDGPTVKGSTW